MTTSTLDTVNYYANLLILQYLQRTKAYAHIQTLVTPVVMPQVSVQTVAFSAAPSSGTFVLSYNAVASAAINWNDSAATIQTTLRAVTGLGSVTVAGSIAGGLLTVTFTGVTPPALLLTSSSNTLSPASAITITETDESLPLAVQDAYNIISGTAIAVGNQLDTIGKYVGVRRSGPGANLSDADFLTLIRIAIFQNTSKNTLYEIQAFIAQFFSSQMLVYDDAAMHLVYFIVSSLASTSLVSLFLSEGLLPKPMGVGVHVYNVPSLPLFSFRTYAAAVVIGEPFNTYSVYNTNWPWLSYNNFIS